MRSTRLRLGPYVVLAMFFFGSSCSGDSSNPTDPATGTEQPVQTLSVVVERLPGSPNFSPDGTWWGYNMSKVVRRGDFVFTYVIENDDNPSTYSTFRIYVKQGDGAWTAGAGFNTTRPGNLLLDSNGALHAFVFEATDIDLNDSVGKLHHYTLAGASAGDITNYTSEVVVDHVAGDETVNIRVRAAMGANNQMVIAFGLGTNADGNTEQVLVKTVGGAGWAQEAAGTQLGHDFYYPFVAVNSAGTIRILPIQDDFEGVGNPNTYQIIRFFEGSGSTWSAENVIDHMAHSPASTHPRLLEKSDLCVDASDGVHIFYKEYLAANDGTTSAITHLTGSIGSWTSSTIDPCALNLNWVKMIEVGGTRYLVGSSRDRLYVMNEAVTTYREVVLPSGIYLYVATRQSGTSDAEPYVDVLLLNGNGGNYPDAENYLRGPKNREGDYPGDHHLDQALHECAPTSLSGLHGTWDTE
jgi:hypothetical protein